MYENIGGVEVQLSDSIDNLKNGNRMIYLLHGMWSNASIFYETGWFQEIKAKGYGVCVINYPGHGRDRAQLKNLKFDDCVKAVTQVIDFFGKKNSVLMGHSLGGLVAQKVYSSHLLVSHQVLLASIASKSWLFGLLNIKPVFMFRLAPAVPKILFGKAFSLSESTLDYVANGIDFDCKMEVMRTVQADSSSLAREMIVGKKIGGLGKRTLVVSAENDRIVPYAAQQRLVRKYSARHILCKGAGHVIMGAKNRKEILQSILDWIE